MPKSKNSLFVAFSFVGKHLLTKFQKISSNGLNFANFLHFWLFFWLFFLSKKGQKAWNRKIVSTYQISENFIKQFEFCQFSSFLAVFLAFFLSKKDQKRLKSKNSFFVAFLFVGKHLHTKFQKISSNGLDFANFLLFWSILAVFWLKNGQKRLNPKKAFL